KKYETIFRDRVQKGQCYRRPYLGTREFSCELFDNRDETPINETIPIGSMFYDIYYDSGGRAEPCYMYNAAIRNGVLEGDNAPNEYLMQSSHIRAEHTQGVKQLLNFYGREE
ncbi:MAG: hypothetical protein LBP51_00975, partial [Deferribacteraceae bacterium]|nr:hypothetical protein [Deferribacteraceae bacterium]